MEEFEICMLLEHVSLVMEMNMMMTRQVVIMTMHGAGWIDTSPAAGDVFIHDLMMARV
jgi:hypothetical protein